MTKSTKTKTASTKSVSKSASKKVATKKSPKNVAAKTKNGNGNGKSKKSNPLQDKLISLFARPTGATMHDTFNAGYQYPAMQALKMAERRGYKVSTKKEDGELTRYYAKR